MNLGLLLLKDKMCWNMEDITFLKQNERKAIAKRGMSNYTRTVLKEWLWADYMLYNHFLKKFNKQVESYKSEVGGQQMFDKIVENFEAANKQVYSECVVSHTDNEHGLKGQFKMALPVVLGYKVNENKTWCNLYATSEMHFTRVLRGMQFPNELKVLRSHKHHR